MIPYTVYHIIRGPDKDLFAIQEIEIVAHDPSGLTGYDCNNKPVALLRCHLTMESAIDAIRKAYNARIDDYRNWIDKLTTHLKELP